MAGGVFLAVGHQDSVHPLRKSNGCKFQGPEGTGLSNAGARTPELLTEDPTNRKEVLL